MSIMERVSQDLRQSMLSKDEARTGALRMVRAELARGRAHAPGFPSGPNQ